MRIIIEGILIEYNEITEEYYKDKYLVYHDKRDGAPAAIFLEGTDALEYVVKKIKGKKL
ncbi:MAG: hypothetical protein KKB31_06020 [Nanoarchaeota archaeon]|nr:hypothetical protein [Nanoarchaeota archaeon]